LIAPDVKISEVRVDKIRVQPNQRLIDNGSNFSKNALIASGDLDDGLVT
jgi:hypothetical protein